MNLKFLMAIFLMVFTLTTVSASFPVKRHVVNSESNEIIEVSTAELETPVAAAMAYDKWVAVAFWFFLGLFAAHRWYAGKPAGWNILFILTLGGLGIWAIIDLINILTDNFV
ncbi:TM2 domain-containing protein [Croceivirga radicis]|uniref:S-adenosyl-L-homocysteine hydrolase n=1 Tax=Croceivirga radicis TaxID=1929488 RepID=A0A1V6LR19_9FLAO|nr:TM2 domain-containing protein [Croceivirga radicis]OQD42641.1 S-adenosyl-L-homocysteine hydrolase [Croceivirga radicis]